MLTIGSLFSGIGGLELGLEWAGLGPVLWQVEIDPVCRRVLAKHWPEVKRYEDVREVGADTLAPVGLICGGFPCQDISSAGKGAGLAGSRSGLWREFARVLCELQPEWVVVENVASGARRWVDDVVRQMGWIGYETLPVPLSAQDVGAPHLRRRIFVVAHAERSQLRQQQGWRSGEGWEDETLSGFAGENGETANPNSPRLQGSKLASKAAQGRGSARGSWSNDAMPQPALCRVDDGPAAWLDRNARLRALGNAVVPQCAEVIGYVIRELAGF
jgi:DNA (cytosine-5)-methyltransferase 1